MLSILQTIKVTFELYSRGSSTPRVCSDNDISFSYACTAPGNNLVSGLPLCSQQTVNATDHQPCVIGKLRIHGNMIISF